MTAKALLPVQVMGRWFALDAAQVREVLGQLTWVVIHGASVEMPGVVAWRGRAIALIDLGAVADMDRLPDREGRLRTVVMEVGTCTVGIPVDAVREVQQVAIADLRPVQATRLRYASGEVDLQGVPVPVLDLGALVDSALARKLGTT